MQSSQPTQKAKVETDASSWRPKLSRLLVPFIFLLASTQLGLHLWPDSAIVFGIRIDYLAPTLYLLDTLILAYLIAHRSVLKGMPAVALAKEGVEAISPDEQSRRTGLIGTFAPILLTNLLFSQNPLATLSWSLHFLFSFVFVSSLPLSSYVLSTLRQLLPLTMLFQVVLGAVQVFLGHTLQGPLYWLGERALSVATPNAARAELFGSVVLRAYGTFSHPNILAGWLVVCLLVLLTLSRRLRPHSPILKPAYCTLITAITACGVALTQSRSAALALFGIIIPFYILKKSHQRLLYFIISLCTMYYVLSPNILSRSQDTSLPDRLTLQNISLKVTQAYPIFGAGTNATISTYPTLTPQNRLLQPDHNSFTLLLSWFGLIGTLSILTALIARRLNLLYPLIPLVPLLLLDHYLLTSPQGMFILLLYLRATIFP